MIQTHDCRCCGGPRQNNGSVCLGCGTPLARCEQPKRKAKKHECPQCCSRRLHIKIEEGRYRCGECNAIFEDSEISFYDDRPDVSLEKKERYEQGKKQRRNRR